MGAANVGKGGESILHPTPSMDVDRSSTSVAEASSTPLDRSHPVPFRPESLSPHHLVITQHLLRGALVQNKSWPMCAKHRVIAKARFAHPCQR